MKATLASHIEYETSHFMPEQKPGRSKQTYGTPIAFIDAVELFRSDYCAAQSLRQLREGTARLVRG